MIETSNNIPAGYGFPRKALCRWTEQFLQLDHRADGAIDATFHLEGNICNGTRVLRFDYHVLLRPSPAGFILEKVACRPVDSHGNGGPESNGQFMCDYEIHGEALFAEVQADTPMVGHTLSEAIAWNPAFESSACLCRAPHRNHKWRIVFHVLHFALQGHENQLPR